MVSLSTPLSPAADPPMSYVIGGRTDVQAAMDAYRDVAEWRC
jgi:hypothetical protein